jgi:hypothetical protein
MGRGVLILFTGPGGAGGAPALAGAAPVEKAGARISFELAISFPAISFELALPSVVEYGARG